LDKDRIQGGAKLVKGSVKEAFGKLTGDKQKEAEGKADQAVGKVQGAVGKAKDTLHEALVAALLALSWQDCRTTRAPCPLRGAPVLPSVLDCGA
jgi:uncharacterized protein YjbJ (UPF0337 family)